MSNSPRLSQLVGCHSLSPSSIHRLSDRQPVGCHPIRPSSILRLSDKQPVVPSSIFRLSDRQPVGCHSPSSHLSIAYLRDALSGVIPAILLSALLLSAATVYADAARLGALGRDDTVITKESDPVASDAIKAESAERKAADSALSQRLDSVHALADGASSKATAAQEAASKASASAASATQKAQEAIADASDAMTEAESAQESAQNALAEADVALAQAAAAKTSADAAKVSATSANATAQSALTKAQEASATAQNALTTTQSTASALAATATKESVASLTDRVTDLESNATATPSAVAALQSRVSAVESTAASAQADASSARSLASDASTASITALSTAEKAAADAASVKATADAAKVSATSASATASSALTKAQEASATAQNAITTANAALAKAGSAGSSEKLTALTDRVSTVESTASSALSKAQEASASAANALTTASATASALAATATKESLSSLTDRVADLEANATATPSAVAALQSRVSAVESASASAQADASQARTLASDASTASTTALSTAEKAAADAASVKSTAETAKTTAQSAQTTASSALSKAQEASASAQNALTTANAALAKAESAGSSEKLTALTDRVTKTEFSLNTMNNTVQDLSASLSAEASARATADGALSARIDTLSTKASTAEASLSSLAAQSSALEASVESISATAKAALNQAQSATASVAEATSKANAATDAANRAQTAANAAQATANDAATTATAAATIVAEIGAQMDDIYAIAEEARASSTGSQSLIVQATRAAESAAKAASSVTNDVAVLYDRTNRKAEMKWMDFSPNYAHLGYLATPNTSSEIEIYNFPLNEAYLRVKIGDGLMRQNGRICLDPAYAGGGGTSGESVTGWVHQNEWRLVAYPGETVSTVVLSSEETSQTELGQTMAVAMVTRTTSLSRAVEAVAVDPAGALPNISAWTFPEGVTSTMSESNPRIAMLSSTSAGLLSVSAQNAITSTSREVLVPFQAESVQESNTLTYIADAEGSARKAANDAMLAILQQRDRTSTTPSGITSAVSTSDFPWMWSSSENGVSYRGAATIPRKYVLFSNVNTEWGPPAVPVAPHYAITASHWNPGASRTFYYFPRLSGMEAWHMSGTDGINLAVWARQNGFLEAEIAEANISDIFVYRMDPTRSDMPSAFPDANIPHILDRSGLEHYYQGSLEGIACYAMVQKFGVSYSTYRDELGATWCSFGQWYKPESTRADILEQLSPSVAAQIYGGDSGRPILFLHNGDTPVLTSIFWTAAYGSSLIGGCEILDAYIKQHSGGTESLKRISAPVN